MFLDAFVSVLLSTANNVNGCERFSVSKTYMCVTHTVIFLCRGREREGGGILFIGTSFPFEKKGKPQFSGSVKEKTLKFNSWITHGMIIIRTTRFSLY